jgi:glycosyltransferase involved in cell wall biosynthesis
VKVRRFKDYNGIRKFLSLVLNIRGAYRFLKWLLGSETLRLLYENPVHPGLLLRTVCLNADVTTVVDWSNSLAWEVFRTKRVVKFPLIALPLFHTEEAWSQSTVFPGMLQGCDHVMVNTSWEKAFVEKLTPRRQNIHVIGAGIDLGAFPCNDGSAFRVRYGLGFLPVVGYIGRLASNKGVVELIKAMQLVWNEKPSTRLVIAGYKPRRESVAAREVDSAIEALSDEERSRVIVLYNFAESEKASMIAALDVFAMPSVGESFGIAYLEAWSGRKPVIGARIGATECVIQDGVDGLLVEPKNSQDLARALLMLLESSDLRNQMGEAGYRKVKSRYSWEAIIDQVEVIYDCVSNANGGLRSA